MKKIFIILTMLLCATALRAQETEREEIDARWFKAHYQKSEQMIPMRDGTKLYTAIFTPKNKKSLHPILLNRTQNGCEPYGKKSATFWQEAIFAKYLYAEYIIVFQDVRGFGHSAGESSTEKGASDAYDTAECLLRKAKKNNGNIGVWGIAEDANWALLAAACGHRAIKAVSAQAPVGEGIGMAKISAPTLFVGGAFDDKSEAQLWNGYNSTLAANPSVDCRLVVGPWTHAAWRKNRQAEQESDDDSAFYHAEVEFPFFDHYLRGAESNGASAAGALIYFTGENCWRELERWGGEQHEERLYFGENGALCELQQPSSSSSSYTVNPENPVPSDVMQTTENRDDILMFTSPILERDMSVAGAIGVELNVKASQPVADFVVRIIDVADNAESEMQVRSVVATKCQITQEGVTKITLKTPDVAHTFMAGHRIKVLLHSTWDDKLQPSINSKCDITLLHDKSHPSHVSFQLQ